MDIKWLGNTNRRDNQVPIPEQVVDLEIVVPEEPLYWTVLEGPDVVFISREREILANLEHAEWSTGPVAETMVESDRTVTVPQEIQQYLPTNFSFIVGDDFGENLCMVVTQEDLKIMDIGEDEE